MQESLTNALRYAAGAAVAVTLRGGADAIDVEVRNAADGARARALGRGHGQRAAAACGSASTRAAARSTPARPPTAGGGWSRVSRGG